MSAPQQALFAYGAAAAAARGTTYFVAGSTGGVRQTNSDKYNMSTDGVASGGSVGTAISDMCGVGNTTVGVIMGGTTGTIQATVSKYTYSGDSVAAGTSLTTATYVNNAVTSATIGYSIGGNEGGGSITKTYKYTYSNDNLAAGTVLSAAVAQGGSGMQVTAKGITNSSNSGGTGTATAIYTYSGDTTSAGAQLYSAGNYQNMGTMNTTTTGYSFGGYTSTPQSRGDKYDISGDSWSGTTSLGAARYNPGTGGDATGGIILGGQNPLGTYPTTSDKFTYSGETMGSGTAISQGRSGAASWSSTPQI